MCVYVLGEIGFWLRITGYVFHTHRINVSWVWCLLARRRDLVWSLWHWNETWNYRIWRRFPYQHRTNVCKQNSIPENNWILNYYLDQDALANPLHYYIHSAFYVWSRFAFQNSNNHNLVSLCAYTAWCEPSIMEHYIVLCYTLTIRWYSPLLTWFNFNPSMDN